MLDLDAPFLEGKYHIERRLGHGSFGVVYKALESFSKSYVAIKEITDDDYKDALLDEIGLMSRLHHPHVVQYKTTEQYKEGLYLVMEYMVGGSLLPHVSEGHKLSSEQAKLYLEHILKGLAYLHAHGIVHRDLKPDNVLLSDDGIAKIADFGVSKTLSKSKKAASRAGTIFYMAPEMFDADEDHGYDHRVDLYAVGCLYYQMLVGTPPFTGSDTKVMMGHVAREVSYPAFLSDDEKNILTHLLEKDADDRFADAEAVIDALQNKHASAAAVDQTDRDREIYRQAICKALANDGVIDAGERSVLNSLKGSLGLSSDVCHQLEADAMAAQGTIQLPIAESLAVEAKADTSSVRQQPESVGKQAISQAETAPKKSKKGLFLGLFLLLMIAAVVVPQWSSMFETSSKYSAADVKAELAALMAAEEDFYAEHASYPSSQEKLLSIAGVSLQAGRIVSYSSSGQDYTLRLQSRDDPALVFEANSDGDLRAVDSRSEDAATSDERSAIKPAPVVAKKYALRIVAKPASSRIRVLNIAPAYQAGMRLEAGRYHIEVSHAGYQTVQRWLEIHDTDVQANISLKPVAGIPSIEMVSIPAGSFQMGSDKGDDDEKPVHKVSIAGFKMAKYELTVGQFRAFVKATAYRSDAEKGKGCSWFDGENWVYKKDINWRHPGYAQTDQSPVVCVSRSDGLAFMRWMNSHSRKAFRFPSESEWEYAARAGTSTDFSFASPITDQKANYDATYSYAASPKGRYREHALAVGHFASNAFGLYDVHGNVYEWTADCYHETYQLAPNEGSAWKGRCEKYVQRGGSWFSGPDHLRSAFRATGTVHEADVHTGIRLAQDG